MLRMKIFLKINVLNFLKFINVIGAFLLISLRGEAEQYFQIEDAIQTNFDFERAHCIECKVNKCQILFFSTLTVSLFNFKCLLKRLQLVEKSQLRRNALRVCQIC